MSARLGSVFMVQEERTVMVQGEPTATKGMVVAVQAPGVAVQAPVVVVQAPQVVGTLVVEVFPAQCSLTLAKAVIISQLRRTNTWAEARGRSG